MVDPIDYYIMRISVLNPDHQIEQPILSLILPLIALNHAIRQQLPKLFHIRVIKAHVICQHNNF